MSFSVDFNYHTHTARCNHASGTAEEYIKRAIEGGIVHMGFSDHAPLLKSNGKESTYRVPMAEAADYMGEIAALREKYRLQINISIGFEMEYYPECFDRMLKTVRDLGAEYLILGQHCLSEELPGATYTVHAPQDEATLKRYVSLLVEGMQSGVFTYVAHPDLFNFADTPLMHDAVREICAVSRECDVPLEINCLGIREHRTYPNPTFWKWVGEEQAPVTLGFDSHDTKSAFDGASLYTVKELIDTYNLHYIGRPTLRKV